MAATPSEVLPGGTTPGVGQGGAPGSRPDAGGGDAGAGGGETGEGDGEVEELAQKIYGHIRERLRAELLTLRERSSLLTDF